MAYTHSAMIRTYLTASAGLIGLLFGSFLNVCATRWPEDESVIKPRSHCRSCNRMLAWWENLPLVSWLALRGRCRSCRAWIGWRYPLVELAVGVLWAFVAWQFFNAHPVPDLSDFHYSLGLADSVALMIFLWLLVALAVFDVENLWLPDRLIWPGIGLGFVVAVTRATLDAFLNLGRGFEVLKHMVASGIVIYWFPSAVFSAAVLVVIRWFYHIIRDQEGIGWGDVKLMAMLGGWIGVKGALLSFALGVVAGAAFALFLLASPSVRHSKKGWKAKKLPLGTFICLGGIVSGLWGQTIIANYMNWAGF